MVKGVGGATVELDGVTNVKVSIGGVTKRVEFKVSKGIEGFAFYGLSEMKKWGMVIDANSDNVCFQDRCVPFFDTKADLMSSCAAMGSENPTIDEPKGMTVRLCESVTLTPNTDMIVTGYIDESDDFIPGATYCLNPITLKQRYGMMVPRIVVTVGPDRKVPILLKNPFPDSVRLFRMAECGFLFETETVDDGPVKDMKAEGDNCEEDTSPDDHPISSLKLDHLPDGQKAEVELLLKKRYKAFSRGEHDLGFTTWITHDIELKEGHTEPIAEPQRTYPLHKREIIQQTVQDLLDQDVIEVASSAYRFWPVLAKKKIDGVWVDAKRFCLDLRKLNGATVKHARMLPKISEVVDAMSGACYFSKIDMQSAYHQIGLTERAKDMCSFCIPGGRQFRQKRLCFGLVNAGSTYQTCMDMVLNGLSYRIALAYLDDVVVWSATFEDHKRDVDLVLRRLEMAGLKARPSKCNFFQDEIEVLGHFVTKNGISPDPMKVKCVENWPVPTNVSELLSFLAFSNFYRRFLRDFSKRAWHLNRLTHKDVVWAWTDQHQNAFDDIKRGLCTSPVMLMPDTSKKFTLDTDWSRKGIGYVLQQEGDDGKLHPILYGSRSLTKSEARYGSTKGEWLAVYSALMACRHYLIGGNFEVRCDNKALSYLQKYRDLTFRTARMLEQIADFGDFVIKHVPGKSNIPADALSRVNWGETKFSEIEKEEVLAPIWQPNKPIDWVKEQSVDDDLKTLRVWLESGAKPPQRQISAFSPSLRSYWFTFDQFELVNGVVMRVWTETDGTDNKNLQVVPLQMRQQVLIGHHDQVAHPGISKMITALRKKYYWFKMSDDVARFVQTCSVCSVVKAHTARAPLVQHPLSYMSQRVFFDMKGPLQRTARGNVYYMVIIDGWSKWTAVIPLPDIRAATVFSAFYNDWIVNMGCPVQLHSDKGTSLVGEVAQRFVETLNIERTTTVSHHQMANGQAERAIKNTIQLIATIIAEEGDIEWDLACPKTAWAINVTPSLSTNQTPWLVKHSSGEEAILPNDLVMDKLPEGRSVDVSIRSLRERQARIFKKVSEATGNALRRQKAFYDQKVVGKCRMITNLEHQMIGYIERETRWHING